MKQNLMIIRSGLCTRHANSANATSHPGCIEHQNEGVLATQYDFVMFVYAAVALLKDGIDHLQTRAGKAIQLLLGIPPKAQVPLYILWRYVVTCCLRYPVLFAPQTGQQYCEHGVPTPKLGFLFTTVHLVLRFQVSRWIPAAIELHPPGSPPKGASASSPAASGNLCCLTITPGPQVRLPTSLQQLCLWYSPYENALSCTAVTYHNSPS